MKNLTKTMVPVFLMFGLLLGFGVFSYIVSAAEPVNFTDDADDLFRYNPETLEPKSCESGLTLYPGYDVILVSVSEDSGEYVFNVTFNGDVNMMGIDLMLFFDVNGSYSDYEDIPPYQAEYNFFIQIEPDLKRIAFNISSQRTISPLLHDNRVLEIVLDASDSHWLTSIGGLLPMSQWKMFGYSTFETASGDVWDYINFPARQSNDLLRCPGFPVWATVLIVLGSIVALGVVVVIILKRKGVDIREILNFADKEDNAKN